ncbi:hypothetical protein [Nonomuraea africana]|uniref:Uncharacterized protein n=1 Tax=Nonomuraea africana TaxID=46171 RepID=A0ABR9K9S2_9ACTN|nr:hypothetical protein [Nonomuraea africana]MBE1558570.1 hypothetical protein [Nonomuraea africana]
MLPVLSVLLALPGCGAERICTLVGTPVGVSLAIDSPLAARVSAAELTACWNGSCTTARPPLHVADQVAMQTCDANGCRARLAPTDGKRGFGEVAGLPKAAVKVRVKLTGANGDTVLDESLTVTPQGRFPNGPDCGEGGPQAALRVSGEGRLSEVT